VGGVSWLAGWLAVRRSLYGWIGERGAEEKRWMLDWGFNSKYDRLRVSSLLPILKEKEYVVLPSRRIQ